MGRVKLYALSTCPWCKKTRQLLAEKAIEHDVVDVDLLSGEELEKVLKEIDAIVPRRAFPITVVGSVVIQGFEPDRILKETGHER